MLCATAFELIRNMDSYIFRTHYFERPWTWIRRGLALIVLIVAVFFIPIDNNHYLRSALILAITFGLIAKPKDDLAISRQYLFYFRKSLVPMFSKVDKYKIEDILSIRCRGVHSDSWELVDIFNGGGSTGGLRNSVEMSFKDGSSQSFEWTIDRKKLDIIVQIFYKVKKYQATLRKR